MYFMINNQLDEIYNLGLTSEIDILAVNKNRKSIHHAILHYCTAGFCLETY